MMSATLDGYAPFVLERSKGAADMTGISGASQDEYSKWSPKMIQPRRRVSVSAQIRALALWEHVSVHLTLVQPVLIGVFERYFQRAHEIGGGKSIQNSMVKREAAERHMTNGDHV